MGKKLYCLNSMTIQYKEVIQELKKPWPRSRDTIIGKICLKT